jgi:hypothetical protein
MKVNMKTLIAVLLISITFSTLLLPRAQATPSQQSDQNVLNSGFLQYLTDRGLVPSSINQQTANVLFQQFLKDRPQYQTYLQQYDVLKDNSAGAIGQRDLAVASLGPVIKSYTTTIKGTIYTVELREGWFSDGTMFLKVTLIGPDGIIDPWIYVTISYLTVQVLWWTVTYGEDDRYYEQYVTNAGGVNEALTFKANWDNQAVGELALSGAIALLFAVLGCPPCGGGFGVLGAYETTWAKTQVDNGYDSSNGLYFQFLDHYLYTQIGSAIVLWVYFFFNGSWSRVFPAPWTDIFALSVGTYSSWAISSMLHNIGNAYGYNRWAWVGVYRG